jgi:hypothetical protein
MLDRDRTFHRLMAATPKSAKGAARTPESIQEPIAPHSVLREFLSRKAEDRHAREALAQDNLYPRIAALSRRVLRSEKV